MRFDVALKINHALAKIDYQSLIMKPVNELVTWGVENDKNEGDVGYLNHLGGGGGGGLGGKISIMDRCGT